MTSNFVTFADAVITDLQTNIAALTSATVHRYAPWNPEELAASAGERHLAVWPMAEAETAEPIGNWLHEVVQQYAVLVWEDASVDASRLRASEADYASFLDVHQSVRARFYVLANESIGGAEYVQYVGTRLADVPGPVRWFVCQIEARFPKAIT